MWGFCGGCMACFTTHYHTSVGNLTTLLPDRAGALSLDVRKPQER